MHRPVLLQEALELLELRKGAFIIDGTLGGGGHARAIAERVGPEGKVLGIDWDREAVTRAAHEGLPANLSVVEGSYRDIPSIIRRLGLPKADGLLLDLGFSSFQIDDPRRGFSFRNDGPLDMRYAPDEGGMTAAEAVNGLTEEKLAEIFRTYGEERHARAIAKAIVRERRKKRIETTGALAEVVEALAPKRGPRGIHPATRIFQALRIFVNGEFENLETLLGCLDACVKPGGRIVIISFHSLEDRIVKRAMQAYAKEKRAAILTKKPLVPGEEERRENPRSRSAKMRSMRFIIS